MKVRVLVLLAAVLVAPLAALSPGSDAQAELRAERAPWWGPGDPGTATDGWHFRFPVVVSNPHDHELAAPVAQVEVDIGAMLVAAGWNARALGASSFPTSFTMDPASLRVVEYTSGFADIASQTPLQARFYPGRFSLSAEAPYDPSRFPVGTVVFALDTTLAPGGARSFMVYFTSTQQGERPSAVEPAPVGGWPAQGWGLTAYGFEQGAQGRTNRLDLFALHPGTLVSVYTYKAGKPALADLPGRPNPIAMPAPAAGAPASAPVTVSVPSNSFWKVEANRPVLVAGRGQAQTGGELTYGGGAFVPSTSGLFVGNAFAVPAYAPEAYIATSRVGTSTVVVRDASGAEVQRLDLSSARPFVVLELPVVNSLTGVGARYLEVQGVPVTVQLAGTLTGTHTVPARTGDVGGSDHIVAAPPGSQLRLRPFSEGTLRVLDAAKPQRQLMPFGSVDVAKPAELVAYPPTTTVATNESWPRDNPVRVLSTVEGERSEGKRPARLATAVGQSSQAGPFYLDDRLKTVTRGPVAVMGAFNGTRVTFSETLPGGAARTSTETVNRDGVVLFQPDPANVQGEALVSLTKPATVAPTNLRDTYARTFPAFGGGPATAIGELQFRGALVRLDIEGSVGGQAVRTIGPGQQATFTVEISNHGHWLRGEPITEEVTLVCDEAPAAWDVVGCGDTATLSTGQSRAFTVRVRPNDVDPGSRLLLKLSAHGQTWNVTDDGQLALLVREAFGVEAWFFAEGGPKDIQDAPTLVQRGATTTIPFVVKNTGTVEDGYELRLFPPNEGWAIETLSNGRPVTSVTLEPGESATLEFEATVGTDPQTLDTPLNLEIVSLANELAFDTLRGRVQVLTRLDVNVRSTDPVGLLEPGKLHSFPIEIDNRGESIVTVTLNASAALPDGWEMKVPVPELSVFPGNRTTLNVTVRPPADARAGERGTIRVVGQAARNPGEPPTEAVVVLTGLVRHVHDLGFPTESLPIRPGPSTELNVPLVNNGNGDEELIVLGLTPAWPFRTAGPLVIAPGETGVLALSVDIPSATPPGASNLTVHASLGRQSQANITLPLVFQATPRIAVSVPDLKPMLPGKSVSLVTEVRADGNVPVAGTLKALVGDGWTVTVEPGTVDLQPGESRAVTFVLEAPSDLPDGVTDIAFAADPGDAPQVTTPARSVPVGRPDLRVFQASSGELQGGGLLVTARVSNNGTVDARDVEVALVRDGETLASATVGRIAPDQSAAVSLATEATGSASGLVLVADPDERFPDPDRSDNVAQLGTSGLPAPPGLAVLVALAAAAALGAWTQRRRSP